LSSYSITSKLPATPPTIFSVMSVLAQKHHAINLGQGFPDYPMNEELINGVYAAMKNGHNQYAHMHGVSALREGISAKVHSLYNTAIDPDSSITITPGGTYAIYTALTSVLRPGDEVIVFEPCFDSYIPNIEVNGARAVTIALRHPGYRIDWEEVRKRITPATRMIMINSPNNPTGKILEKEDLVTLEEIISGTRILVLSDEVYEHIIFDGQPHESVLKYPGLLARSFAVFSFGKVYHCTGWKLGYCIAPEPLMKEFRKIHQFNCFTCNAPVQYALAGFLEYREEYLGLGSMLQKKRDYFQRLMLGTPFKPLPSSGSYFQLYDYSGISREREADFAVKLTEQAGVASIPLSSFYKDPVENQVLRFCFAKKESTLAEAVERIQRHRF